MLVLYRTAKCPRCARIEETLATLRLAHRIVVVKNGRPVEGLPAGATPPVLVDDGTPFIGADAILARLSELEAFRKEWYKFQSDACYCNTEGGIE